MSDEGFNIIITKPIYFTQLLEFQSIKTGFRICFENNFTTYNSITPFNYDGKSILFTNKLPNKSHVRKQYKVNDIFSSK